MYLFNLFFLSLFCIVNIIVTVQGLLVEIHNSGRETVQPAAIGNLPNTNISVPLPPFPKLNANMGITVMFPDYVSGRVWMQTGWDGQKFAVGDCGNANGQCNRSSVYVTLIEFTIFPNIINYDISIGKSVVTPLHPEYIAKDEVDGHSHPMDVSFPNTSCTSRSCNVPPWLGTSSSSSPGTCQQLDCPAANIWFRNDTGCNGTCISDISQVAGCKSNCSTDDLPQNCCSETPYNSTKTCFESNPAFRKACPGAFTFAFSDYAAGNDTDIRPLQTCPNQLNTTLMRITVYPS